MNQHSNIYCQAALFGCTCCGSEKDIYSNQEFLDTTDLRICENCKRAYNIHFDPMILYTEHTGEKPDYDINMMYLPGILENCSVCISRTKIHWTELLVYCHACEKESIVFIKYIKPPNILSFYERCVEWAKPSHPLLEFIDKRGHLIYGDYSDLSAN